MAGTRRYPLGEWLPDLAPHGHQGCIIAKNVLPQADGYRSKPSFNAVTAALTAYARGHVSVKDDADVTFNYSGDETNLYVLNANVWDDISSATYTTASDVGWEFAKFGQNLYAVNLADAMQSVALGSVSTLFVDAAGSPPKARHIAVIRDFLVVGYIDASGTIVPERIHWSGINNPATWAVSATTQADVHDFPDGGPVRGIAGGEVGVIMQEFQITRMSYAGSPVIFQMDTLEPDLGLFAPGAFAQHGNLIFFISQDGFRVMVNASSSEPIGNSKVDRTFFAEVDNDNIHRITVAIDSVDSLVYFNVPVTGNTGGLPNKQYIYDWINGRWSFAEKDCELITNAASSGYTMDGLDVFALGSELITNGAFAADTDWTKGTGWTIGSGNASSDGTQGADADLTQTISITEDVFYYVSFTVSGYSAGNVAAVVGDTEGTDRGANGTFTETIRAGSGGDFDIRADLDFIGNIDDVTVKASTTVDALTESLDSRAYTGGLVQFAAFDGDHKFGFFSGTAEPGTIEPAEFEFTPGRRSNVRGIRPLVDGGATVTVQIGARARQTDTFSFEAGLISQETSGKCSVRKDGRFHRVRILTAGNFDFATAFDAIGSPTGRR